MTSVPSPPQHVFETDLGMTLRQACAVIYKPECFAKKVLETVSSLCSGWERLTDNPPIRNITPEIVSLFDSDLQEVGLAPSTRESYRDYLQAVLNRMRYKGYATKRKPKERPDDNLPTELDDTLLSHFELLYRRQRLAQGSPSTVRKYRIAIRHWSRILRRPPVLSDLTDQGIINVMTWMVDRNRSPETCNGVRAKLVSLWGFLAKKRIVEQFPDVQLFNAPERTPQAWSRAQLSRLFAALAKQSGTICGLPAAGWWVSLHLFLWNTAERVNAGLTLKVSDLDLDTGWIRVRAVNRKGRTRDRSYRLDPKSLLKIRAFVELDPAREFVWPCDITREMIWIRYGEILKKAGLPHGRESKFHRMRRTALSFFKSLGGDATQLADHSSSETTRRSYLDPTIVIEQQASDLLWNPLDSVDENEKGAQPS